MLNPPSCGAGTPPTAATRFGDVAPAVRDEPDKANHPPRVNERWRRCLNNPTVDVARPVHTARHGRAGVRRSLDRRAGVIGINMPWRPIEDVALADGTCRDLPALIESPTDSGAAGRECSLLRNPTRPAANNPNARSSPMRFLREWVICVLVFFVGPTLRMSRALSRSRARRLHSFVGPPDLAGLSLFRGLYKTLGGK